MVNEVMLRGNNEEFEESIIQRTSFLIYRIASGQHFHEGNKRTALVASSAFLQLNSYAIDIRNRELVSVIDRAGIVTAGLNDIYKVKEKLIRNVREGA